MNEIITLHPTILFHRPTNAVLCCPEEQKSPWDSPDLLFCLQEWSQHWQDTRQSGSQWVQHPLFPLQFHSHLLRAHSPWRGDSFNSQVNSKCLWGRLVPIFQDGLTGNKIGWLSVGPLRSRCQDKIKQTCKDFIRGDTHTENGEEVRGSWKSYWTTTQTWPLVKEKGRLGRPSTMQSKLANVVGEMWMSFMECSSVVFLVLMVHYSYARCHHWERLNVGCIGPPCTLLGFLVCLFIFCFGVFFFFCNFCESNYFKTKSKKEKTNTIKCDNSCFQHSRIFQIT